MDELDVVVETRSILAGKLSGADLAGLERSAEHQIRAFVGISTKVQVVGLGTLERSQGKAQCVLDPRPKG